MVENHFIGLLPEPDFIIRGLFQDLLGDKNSALYFVEEGNALPHYLWRGPSISYTILRHEDITYIVTAPYHQDHTPFPAF